MNLTITGHDDLYAVEQLMRREQKQEQLEEN